MNEAARKRHLALESAGPFATNDPADVRWLLCGRGAPVSAGSSPYTVVVTHDRAQVLYPDIERSRVESEERWEELGYEPVAYPWYEPAPTDLPQPRLEALRRLLGPEERERYRLAGADVAACFVAALEALAPRVTEREAVGAVAAGLHAAGFTTPVLLAGGERRAPRHRHPLPTEEPLGAFALLAVTAERDGLYVSMTRIVSFGSPPSELQDRVRAAAEVDGAVIASSRPEASLGDLFAVLERAYADQGYPDEWRLHHQGGLTGYRGREVFAIPGDSTRLPSSCALAWNPSISGGGKSEDTVLVSDGVIEVVTRTPQLGETPTAAGIARAAIVEL